MNNWKKRLAGFGVAAVLIAGVLSGCGASKDAGNTGSAGQGDGHYPVTVTTYDYDKKEVTMTFEKAPEKVLAVYQNSIETMLALGLEDKIVAASGLDHPVKEAYKDAFSKVNYLSEFKPSKESATALEPDFILSWYSLFEDKSLGSVKEWQKQGINSYTALNSGAVTPKTLENEYTDLSNLGKIFNVEGKANTLIDEIKSAVNQTVEYAKTESKKPKVIVIENYDSKISNYNASTLAGDMVTALGGEMIASEETALGQEDVIKANPEVIFVVYMDGEESNMAEQNKEAVTKNPVYADVDAVKNGRVYPIELGEMYCSGVRSIDGIHTFAKGMYPNLEIK